MQFFPGFLDRHSRKREQNPFPGFPEILCPGKTHRGGLNSECKLTKEQSKVKHSRAKQNRVHLIYCPTTTNFRKSDVVRIFFLLFFRYYSRTLDRDMWQKTTGKKQGKKKRLVCQCISPNLKTKCKKNILVFISFCQISRSAAKSSSFQALFLKRLKDDIMNSITFEVTISKNKRARHVVENNRFVLTGKEATSKFLFG